MSIAIMKKSMIAACVILAAASIASARMAPGEDQPRTPVGSAAAGREYCTASHNIGKISLASTNFGTYGTGFAQTTTDCFGGGQVPSCEYPVGSGTQYTFAGAFWIGAVVGRDTLVTVGADGWQNVREMEPLDAEFGGKMIRRSIVDPSSPEFENAMSEQDFISKYADTARNLTASDVIDGRPHRPLGIEVTEASYAWSYSYAEDFVLFDYKIKNNSPRRLSNVYMGIYCDADVGAASDQNASQDDICGFLLSIPSTKVSSGNCAGLFQDTVNAAWISDNDGDFSKDIPVPHVTATRVVRTPAETLRVSFNWWISNSSGARDFGPMMRVNFRDLGTGGQGTPEGDRNKYFYLRNQEFDYDQVFTAAVQPDDPTWTLPPPSEAGFISKGIDTRYLLSFGRFNLDPGQTVPISFCYVGGENFHLNSTNFATNMNQNYRPSTFYNNLNFTDLGLNSMWASWLYDNPGFDSDDDGYRGKSRVCVTDVGGETQYDTIYYEGDNVPDFRGAAPPPAPKVWLLSEEEGIKPTNGKIIVRFNGMRSEIFEDIFSGAKDFEGYRVYMGLDERPSSIGVVTSYDLEDYNKYTYNPNRPGGAGWDLLDLPFTRVQLETLYGTGLPGWNPLDYTPSHPWRDPRARPEYDDSLFYFAKQDYNNSRLGTDTKIRKRFPSEPLPPGQYIGLLPDSALATLSDSVLDLYFTSDGYLKYYEYVDTIEGLLPTVPYFINVTAFDFGSPSSGLGSLETSPVVGIQSAYPQGPAPTADDWKDKVYVYPNPYRIDGGYQAEGFEGREKDLRDNAPDRKRKVNFANLPPKCTIRVYTLDGDMVKQIDHDVADTDPLYSHATWDLITRNTQLIVSGLYYWTVEDPQGNTQIGKLVILM